MKRTQVLSVLFAVFLAVSGMPMATMNAQAKVKAVSDGPAYSTEWSDSTYSDGLARNDYNGTTDPIELEHRSASDDELDFDIYDSKDADVGVASGENYLRDGPSSGTKSNFFTGALSNGLTVKGDYAYGHYSGRLFKVHLETGDWTEVCYDQNSGESYPVGNLRGMEDGYGEYEIVIAQHRDFSADRFIGVNTEDCTWDQLQTTDGEVKGLADIPGADDQVYFIDGQNNDLEVKNLKTGDALTRFNLPSSSYKGLGYKEFSNGKERFYLETGGNNIIQVLDGDGNEVDQYSFNKEPRGIGWANSEDKKYLVTATGSTSDSSDWIKYHPYSVYSGNGEGNIQYTRTLSGEDGIINHDVKKITWSGTAPSTFDGRGSIELQVRDDGGSWTTEDTVSAGTGDFSAREVTLGSSYDQIDDLQYRVVYKNYKLRGGATASPRVQAVSWDYEWYAHEGVIQSTKLDTRDAGSFDSITIDRSAGGQGVDVRVLDRNKNTILETTQVDPDATVDLSSLTVNESTQYIYVELRPHTLGKTTPSINGWELIYDGNPSAAITATSATYSDANTTVTNTAEITSDINSTDEFTIEEVNQTVESVEWQINGETQQIDSVASQGPFTFSHTWDSSEVGVNTVTATVTNRNGTASYTWYVDIPQPSTVKLGTVDIIEDQTQTGTGEVSESVTVDFPGDNQSITTDLGTQYQVAIDTSNPNVTYDVTMSVSSPVGTSTSFTGLQGDSVKSGSASLPTKKTQNFDGNYELTVKITITNGEYSTFDVHSVFKQQIADASASPDITSQSIPTAGHVGEPLNVSAEATSEISNMDRVYLEVQNPDGTTDVRAVEDYNLSGGDEATYDNTVTFQETGTYRVTFVAENNEGLTDQSHTYVVDVRNQPPEGSFITPPTQVNANRSFTVDWTISDPENDPITETGVILTSPRGEQYNVTDAEAGSGAHTLTVGQGTVTQSGLWSMEVYGIDDKGGYQTTGRTLVEVVSLQEYDIRNGSVETWNGTETTTLDAGRAVSLNAEVTPNVSTTTNATVYANLETQSGTLVSELWTATGVTLENNETVTLEDIAGGPVNATLPANVNGSYTLEIGVVSDEGESTYPIGVDVRGHTTGQIQSVDLNTKDVYPPEFVTATSTVLNDGDRNTAYRYTVQVTKNGTVYQEKSVNTSVVGADNLATVGSGFSVDKTLEPGDYTLKIVLESKTHHESWEPFDSTSTSFTVKKNRQADIGKVHMGYEEGVIQGFAEIENDGNVKLDDGHVKIRVKDGATRETIAIENVSVSAVDVGNERQIPVNFNFSADRNTTYLLELAYADGTVRDVTYTQIATAPRPSMEVVEVGGPGEVVQGENKTYTVTVRNNGDVPVDSTSLVIKLQTNDGQDVYTTGKVIDVTYPGRTQTVSVELPFEDASLLGQSSVTVVGQAATGKNSTLMLPRDEDVFVSAPGFIISGDSAFSDVSVGEQVTMTQTFLITGRPDASINVDLKYDQQALRLISGEANQTITSGSSLSWTFVVQQDVSGSPVSIVAESGEQQQAKDVRISTTGAGGTFGDISEGLPDSYGEVFTNTYLSAAVPGYPNAVYWVGQWILALVVVMVIEFADATTGWGMVQKHGSALVAAGWLSGVLPSVMLVVTVVWGGLVYAERKHLTIEEVVN